MGCSNHLFEGVWCSDRGVRILRSQKSCCCLPHSLSGVLSAEGSEESLFPRFQHILAPLEEHGSRFTEKNCSQVL